MSSSISSNVLWKFAERFSAQIVSFIVSLVLARILAPTDYGTVALVLVFIEIANVFVSSGLGSSLIQKKNADELDFSSVLYFNFGLSIVLYLCVFFTAPLVASFYANNLLIPVLRVFGLRIIVASINSVQQAYVSKKMIFKKFFLATLFGTVLSGAVGIVLAYKGFGVWALVAQYLINVFVDTIILAITLKWRPILAFSWRRIGSLLKYGWKILYEGLANTISVQIRSLVIGKVYRDEDLGYYTKAQQFPQLIMVNIGASISSVLFPALSNVQDEDEKMLYLMRKSVKVSSYILFPMLVGVAAVATNLVTVLLTDKWIDCVPYLYIFCFYHFLTVGMYSRHEALKAKGKSGVYMLEHILSRVITLVALICVYKRNVLAVALSGLTGTILMVFVVMYTSKKYNHYKYSDQIKDIGCLLMMVWEMFIVTYRLGTLLELHPLIELVIQVIVGVAIYMLMSIVLKPEGYTFLIEKAKNIFSHKKKEVNQQ